MKFVWFLFPRPCALTFFLLLFTLAAARGAQPPASKPAPEGKRTTQRTSGTQSEVRRQVRVAGEILRLPQEATNTETIQRYLKKADTISSGTMEAFFMTDPETRLLLRPRITIAEGEEGSIQMEEAEGKTKTHPMMNLRVKPTFQPDGQIRTITGFALSDGKSTQTLKNERLIRPNTGRSTFIGMCRQKKDNVYVFLTLEVVPQK